MNKTDEATNLLILCMSVYPSQEAMGLLVHHLANTLADSVGVIVCGKRPTDAKIWDGEPKYQIETLAPSVISIQRGSRYHVWSGWYQNKKKLNDLCQRHNITHVLACFPDEYHVSLARRTANENRIPYFLWFHNTYLENRSGLFQAIARWLQPKLLRDARGVFTISEGLTEYYQAHYPQYAFKTVLHGFPKQEPTSYVPIKANPVRFAMTGSLNASCFDAASRLARVVSRNRNYELHVFGKRNAARLMEGGIDATNCKIHGFLNEPEFKQRLAECDIMLLPHGLEGDRSDVEYNTIFPTRTIPLLTSGRPILAHTPRGVFFTDFLQENNCALVVDEKSEAKIAAAIDQLIENSALSQQIVINAARLSARYDVREVAQKFLADIETLS